MKQELIETLKEMGYNVVSVDEPIVQHDGKTLVMHSRVCEVEDNALNSIVKVLSEVVNKQTPIYVYRVETRSLRVMSLRKSDMTTSSIDTVNQVVFRGYYE